MARFELFFIYSFSVIFILSSLFLVEFYPFSHYPMFSKKVNGYSQVTIKNHNGQIISPDIFNLQLNYVGIPEFLKVGITPKQTFNTFGTKLTPDQVKKYILKNHQHLKSLPLIIQLKHYGFNSKNENLEEQVYEFSIVKN